ncbi:MAG: uroporphyrinogen-III synthase [Bacteroidota bacterium]
MSRTDQRKKREMRRIWVTRELGDEDLERARRLGLAPVIRPAIRIVPVPPGSRFSIPDSAIWIFTSKNGVAGLASWRENGVALPDPQTLFAVGEQTAKALNADGLQADWPAEENAAGLAHMILRWIDLNVDESKRENLQMIHWCGSRSRPELADILQKAGYSLIRHTVYKTELATVQPPEQPVDAILFYSPSAVEAVQRSRAWPDPMPRLYAIGATTAEALSLESNHPVQIPEKPSTDALLDLVARDLNRSPNLTNDTES